MERYTQKEIEGGRKKERKQEEYDRNVFGIREKRNDSQIEMIFFLKSNNVLIYSCFFLNFRLNFYCCFYLQAYYVWSLLSYNILNL